LVLNRTVTDARLTLLAQPGSGAHFTLACLEGTRPTDFALFGSTARLLLVHTVEVMGEHCSTVSYSYRLSAGSAKESWLIRWEYFRDLPRPDYRYPLAHVHVNAGFAESIEARELPRLHVPTARIALELVLWHLIAEWEVDARTDDWRALLAESMSGFEDRRQAR